MERDEVLVLRQINGTLDKIYEHLSKQPGKWAQLFNLVVAVVGILGIIGVIDIILKWILNIEGG